MGNEAGQQSTAIDLVARIENGDQLAEQELVSKYWKGLLFVLQHRCNDSQLAADIAQDAFIVVITKARDGEIKEPGALAAFIRQIGVNLLIAHFRKEKRRATDGFSTLDVEFPDTKNSLTQLVESRQALKLVRQVLDEMTVERDREILQSFFLKEEDKISICERLSLTSQHFDRVLYRARNRLKQLIEFKLGSENVF